MYIVCTKKMGVSLFGKGREKILEFFYNIKGKEAYFSEILRQTKLTQNTTLKHLQLLEENKIIIKTKKIGNTFYRLNPNNKQVFSLMSYLDFKRYNALESGKKRVIEESLPRVSSVAEKETKNNEKSGCRHLIPFIALVFFMKKTLSLLLVHYDDISKKEQKTQKLTTYHISFSYFNDQILRKTDPILKEALNTGIVIRGHDLYYELILR